MVCEKYVKTPFMTFKLFEMISLRVVQQLGVPLVCNVLDRAYLGAKERFFSQMVIFFEMVPET